MIWKRDFEILTENPLDSGTKNIFDSECGKCETILPVYADLSDSSDHKNDWTRWIEFFSPLIQSGSVALIKDDGQVIAVSGVGAEYTLGFYANRFGTKPMGAWIDWRAVLAAYGAGIYQIRLRGVYNNQNVDKFSFKFRLAMYDEDRVSDSVRISYTLNGIIGDFTDQKKQRDFQNIDWNNRIRIPFSHFGRDNSNAESEFVRYQSGIKKPTSYNRKQKFLLNIGRVCRQIHNYIEFEVLMGSSIRITDYTKNNPTPHINTEVVNAGNYAPEYTAGSNLARVEVELESAYDLHYKLK